MPLKKARVKRAYKPRIKKVAPKNSMRSLAHKLEKVEPFTNAKAPNGEIPNKKRVRLNMVQRAFESFGGVTGVKYIQIRSNSMNSPCVTYTWHQPMYYDQYAPLYGKVVVYKTTWTVDIVNHSTNRAMQALIWSEGTVTPTPASYIDVFYAKERGRCSKMVTIPPQGTKKISFTVTPYKLLGRDKDEWNAEEFAENVSTTIGTYNPAYQCPLTLAVINVDPSDTSSFAVFSNIQYHAEYFEKSTTAHS